MAACGDSNRAQKIESILYAVLGPPSPLSGADSPISSKTRQTTDSYATPVCHACTCRSLALPPQYQTCILKRKRRGGLTRLEGNVNARAVSVMSAFL